MHNESSVDLADAADDFPPGVVEKCLSGLESRPQWWTSYSNSRQNAIVICQAARVETEKEELLNLHLSLAKNTASINSALRDAVSENAQHKAFVETVYKLRNQLTTELQEDRSRLKTLFTSLLHDFESAVGASVSKALSHLRDVEIDSTSLSQGMRLSVTDISHLRDQINEIYTHAERRNIELKDLHDKDTRDIESNQQLALSVQSSLNNLQERIAGVDGALEWLVGRFATIYQQETLILERLHAFETHLNKSEVQARELLKTQTVHARAIESQAQAQEALGASAKVVFAILEKLTTRAANLETILEETADRFNDLQHLDGLFGIKISAWTAFSLLLSVIAVQNPKVAAVTFAFAGFALVYRALSYLTPLNFPAFF
ncbi:hypothetical protein UA08_08963 [Talaromyces atroroseus]|uniref:Nuclear membrane fusion protein Kar5 n=1 Tax=Talaromyces atroroseus TaxID=1441469 RepID=A0A1Q5Q7B6_TALAT|nr:hypothetical protein UA08_08963 [Talaromyces atroroseus]OKL55663.1 hypothetical protein UA08_08963 [Talaromyces atroroseus]